MFYNVPLGQIGIFWSNWYFVLKFYGLIFANSANNAAIIGTFHV